MATYCLTFISNELRDTCVRSVDYAGSGNVILCAIAALKALLFQNTIIIFYCVKVTKRLQCDRRKFVLLQTVEILLM